LSVKNFNLRKMDWTKLLHILVLLNILGLCQAFFETCDQTLNIAAGQTLSVQSPGYSSGYGYNPGSSCRYTISAPIDYQVRASCSLIMYDPSYGSCSSERFYFAVDGKTDLSTSTYYCGATTVALTSKGNVMVLAYVSNSYNGTFNCNIATTCDCGWGISSRIVGGTAAVPNEFPPMVGLFSGLATNTAAKVYCGATIVSSKFCVTAAHCLRVTTVANTGIIVGDNDISTGSDTPYAAVYRVARFIEHTSYSNITNLNDIGLVQTQDTILLSRAVAPACLPFFYTSTDFSGTVVTATGWGSTSFGGPSSNVLQKVNLNVISNTNAQCVGTYPTIASSQMCTFTAGKDTCQYDSGGPLFYRGPTDPRLFLVAATSLGDACASNSPALNTRMTSYLSWIESYTGSLCRRAIS